MDMAVADPPYVPSDDNRSLTVYRIAFLQHSHPYRRSQNMPIILLPEGEGHWLDPDMSEPEAIVSLLRPYPADLVTASRA